MSADKTKPVAVRPYGWASPAGGSYFTRSELSARRIGGLVPIFTAAQLEAARAEARKEALYQALCAIRDIKQSHAGDAGEPVDDPACDIQAGINLAWEAVWDLRALADKEKV
jgi:hypothetical protein